MRVKDVIRVDDAESTPMRDNGDPAGEIRARRRRRRRRNRLQTHPSKMKVRRKCGSVFRTIRKLFSNTFDFFLE